MLKEGKQKNWIGLKSRILMEKREREEMKNLEPNKYFSAILSGDCHD